MYKKASIVLTLILILLVLIVCSGLAFKDYLIPSPKETLSYSRFIKLPETALIKFRPDGFALISQDDIINQITVFPNNIKFDTRTNDGVNGNPAKPSKYISYYINNDLTVLVKLSFIYFKSGVSGIVYESITSPVDNIGIDEQYSDMARPFIVDRLISRKDYLISSQFILINDNKVSGNSEDKIQYLIDEDIKFHRQLENFIIETEKQI